METALNHSEIKSTPLPERSDGGVKEFEKLLIENGGCELPCWWGFYVGEAKKEDWLNFLETRSFTVLREEPLSDGSTIPTDYAYFSFPKSTTTSVIMNEGFEDDILEQLVLTINEPNKLLSPDANTITLPGILKRLLELPKIYVFIGGTSSSLNLPILVVYDDIGLMVQYTFNVYDPKYADTTPLCFGLENTTQIQITLQDPDAKEPVSAGEQRLIDATEPPQWLNVEKWLEIDTESFAEFFREHPDGCLDLSPSQSR